MEASQSLAIESFSYSWLSNHNTPLHGIDELNRASMEEFDSMMVESNSFLIEQNFKFDAISQTPTAFIHADELFIDGFIKPVDVNPSKREPCNSSDAVQATPSSSLKSKAKTPVVRLQNCRFFRWWKESTQQILRNLFEQLRHGCSRKSRRVDNIDQRAWKARSWNSSPLASPRQGDSSHLENSIHEAILHCKRSIEK